MIEEKFHIETERLKLRDFKISDAFSFFHLNLDEEVMKYTGDVTFDSVEETEIFLNNYSDYERNGFGRWTVVRKEDNEILGWCGLKKRQDGVIDIGYRFHKKFWNKGYATESARACLNYGFEVLNLEEIIGNTDRENLASIKVLEKIGLKFWKNDKYDGINDSVQYIILKMNS
ncbi:GNAT family N-acetyltransferase [Flavobacteriales bacterium]|nr:GNAT family N-acetyltransferase [Flavobacteriales bacterium]